MHYLEYEALSQVLLKIIEDTDLFCICLVESFLLKFEASLQPLFHERLLAANSLSCGGISAHTISVYI